MTIRAYTANYNFGLISFDSTTWHTEDDARWNVLDGVIASIEGDIPFVVATGSADAFVLTYSPAVETYSLGQVLSFIANFEPTGAATINVNGLGARTLKFNGADISAGDIPSGSYVRVIYDGTNFNLIDPKKPTASTNFVFIGPSGGTPDPLADAWYVESDQATLGISLLGTNTSTQRFLFSRANDADAGGFIYDHTFDTLAVRVAGATAATFGSDGKLTNTNGFVGPLTGEVTGNASTATKWATARTLSFTGDATGSGILDGTADLPIALTIPAASVENSQLANMATATFKGRTTAGAGAPEDLTPAQATALLNVFSTAGLKGLVPAPTSTGIAHFYVLTAAGSFIKGIGRAAGGRLIAPETYPGAGTIAGAVNIASTAWTDDETITICTVTLDVAMANTDYQVHVSPRRTAGVGSAVPTIEVNSTTEFEIKIPTSAAYEELFVSVFEG